MNYLICSTGRARSGVLASYLRHLKIGNPDEFYERLRFDWNMRPQETAQLIKERTVNGVFGMRMVWSHVACMQESLGGLTIKQFVDKYMPDPHYIFMTRCPIKQAVESVMYGMRKEGKTFHRKFFDTDAAIKRMTRIVIGNTAWQMFFKRHDITPIKLDANKLEVNPISELRSLLLRMGVSELDTDIVVKNHFGDSLMNGFRDEMCERFIAGQLRTMRGVDVREHL